MAEQVRREDGTRPLADGSDIEAWAQGSLKSQQGQLPHGDSKEFDNGSEMAQALASNKKPFLTKEIYTAFPSDADDIDNLKQFFHEYYLKAYAGGGTGVIVQHLPLIQGHRPFRISWLSESGEGNRNTGPDIRADNLPNWCDSSQPLWTPTLYSELFTGLYRTLMKLSPTAYEGEMRGEILLSGLDVDEMALLVPKDPAVRSAIGIRAAQDGTGWIVGLRPGAYRLLSRKKSVAIHVYQQVLPERPGYSLVQRVSVSGSDSTTNAHALATSNDREALNKLALLPIDRFLT